MGNVAALVCAIAFALFMLALVMVVLKLAKTMSLTNRILDDLRKEGLPLVSKLQTTMDHVNNEMGYIDKVLESTEKMAARADSLTRMAQQLITSPLVRIVSLGVGVQRALGVAKPEREDLEAEAEGD